MRKRRVNSKNKSADWAWVVIAGALFGVVIIVSLGLLLVVRASQNTSQVVPTANVVELLPTAVDARDDLTGASGSVNIGETIQLPDGSTIEITPWDGQSRFTMVVVGLDRRPGETGLAYRTDTMMLVSLDPIAKSLGVLSIPRDLYVQVPGFSELQRINTPMFFGESRQPGYGPTLMMQSVQLNLGMRVNDYIAVDFDAFIEFINAIGGIDIETNYTINDQLYPSMNYGYDPFYLPAGQHHLNGYDALRFARTRHGDSDISRAERQQQVLYAIRDRILRLDMVPQLLFQAPTLWASWNENVYTGLTLEQMIQLALFAKDVDLDDIKMGVINFRYLQSYTTNSGASVLIPNRGRLGQLMVEVFGESYSQ